MLGASCGSSGGGGGGGSSPSGPSGTLTIISPSDGQTFGYNTSILLNYTISNATASDCWYVIDYNISQTLSSCAITYFNVSSGIHRLEVHANVSGGSLGDTHTFTVNLNAPTISLSYPINNSYVSTKNINFTYTPSENPASDLNSCELWGDFTGTYGKNQTNSTPLSNANNFFSLSLSDRQYKWAISCLDNEGNRATTENSTFILDSIGPIVNISQPKGTFNRNYLIPLNFTAQDSNAISCMYNVTSVSGGSAVISRMLPGCANTTFTIADGNYTLLLQAQAGGLTSVVSTNFLVNTSGLASLLSFVSPTVSNGSSVNGSFSVNVSSSDTRARYVALDFNNSLVTWLRMDDTSSDGILLDISSYANTIDTMGTRQVQGKWGSALYFVNSSDRIQIRDGSAVDLAKAFTVSFWFNGNDSSTTQFLVGKWDGTTANDIAWEFTLATGGICNGLDFYVSEDGGSTNRVYARKCNQSYQDGLWHHVVGVFEPGKNISIYVDRNSSSALAGNVSNMLGVYQNDEPIYIGSRTSATYNGSIDEVLIFNRALSSQEVGALFNASTYPYYRNFTNVSDGTYTFRAFSVNTLGVQNQTEKRTVTLSMGCGIISCSPVYIPKKRSSSLWNWIIVIHVTVLGLLIASLVYVRRKDKRQQALAHYSLYSHTLNSVGREHLKY